MSALDDLLKRSRSTILLDLSTAAEAELKLMRSSLAEYSDHIKDYDAAMKRLKEKHAAELAQLRAAILDAINHESPYVSAWAREAAERLGL